MQMRFGFKSVLGCALALLAGCHSGSRPSSSQGALRLSAQGAPFSWHSASCADGALDLAALGFERQLNLSEQRDGLRLILETELAPEACRTTAIWSARPGNGPEPWHFEPRSLVFMPQGKACGASEREAVDGRLRLAGDVLELELQRSPWCRGFDAHFVYLRSEPKKLDPERLVMRYFAAFNAADAEAVANLFVEGGAFIEPFSRTNDTGYKRHEGREAVRRWHEAAFASSPWLAMNLTSIDPGSGPGHYAARWDYMDAQLAEPLHGRSLFVVAEGEIYETELQLIDDPKPAPAPAVPETVPGSSSVPAPAAGAKVHAP